MPTAQEELKAINAKKKELAEQAKEIREALNSTKEERKELSTAILNSKKLIKEHKTLMRETLTELNQAMKVRDCESLKDTADSLVETSTSMASHIKTLSESLDELENM